MSENRLADLSTEFAIKILELTDSINGHYSLSNQLVRAEQESKYLEKNIIMFVAQLLDLSILIVMN